MVGPLVREAELADERPAFSSVIRPELSRAYQVAGYILSDATEAQDAVQEAMERAWSGWTKLRDPEAARAWFWRILVNVCRSQLAARRRSRVRELDTDFDCPDPTDPFRSSLLRDEVGRAMATLEPDQRTMIVLRFWGQLSVPEIAERMGIREGTIKSRLHYTLQALRRQVERTEEAVR